MKKVFAALSLSSVLYAAALGAQVKISPSVKEGDTISGTVVIRVTVESKSTINQVEFYVNGELRLTDTSTPYLYTLDTIPEKEGPLKLEIGAYAASGDSKKITLNLNVDNQVTKGAKFHLDNAYKFLNVGKWDEAVQAARVALKADENSAPAKIVMARAYLGKGSYDKAQQWAEDALVTQESEDVTELLAVIHAERAFRIISMSGDKGDALKEIVNALKAAIAQRQATLRQRLKALGPPTDKNRLQFADILLEKHDYSAARRMLLEKWDEAKPDAVIGNRLVYATMRSGRITEAYRLLQVMHKKGVANASTYALLAAGHAYFRHFDQAADAIKSGGFDDPDSPQLMAASAYVAILRGDKTAAASQISRMLRLNLQSAQVYYYLLTLTFFTAQFSESRDYFRKTVVADPLLYDAYVERGYEALSAATANTAGLEKDKPLILEQARAFFDLALAVKPDSSEALNGMAIALDYLKKPKEALDMAKAAVSAGPEYPWNHFTLAHLYNEAGDNKNSIKEVDIAGKLDKVVLEGRGIPSVDEAWTYTYRYARPPAIIPPKS